MAHPLLLGHRGLRLTGEPPENTIPAFERALELGCDGFEFDVRRTADGQAVICHDPAFLGRELAETSYSELGELPRLDDVLAGYHARAFLDIELKVPGLEKTLLDSLERHPPQSGYLISSFFPGILQDLKRMNSSLPLGFIADRESSLAHWPELPIAYVIPQFFLLNRELLHAFQSAGKRVMVWTVNRPADMKRFRDWGVDGIVSDDPALLVQTVGK